MSMKHIKSALPIIALMSLTSPATADCYGGDNFKTCTDSSGNTYDVQKFGNQTTVSGRNSQTGSRWSQDTVDFGNGMTSTTGRDADGNRWTQDSTYLGGGMTSVTGRDSNGNRYSATCDQFGCQ